MGLHRVHERGCLSATCAERLGHVAVTCHPDKTQDPYPSADVSWLIIATYLEDDEVVHGYFALPNPLPQVGQEFVDAVHHGLRVFTRQDLLKYSPDYQQRWRLHLRRGVLGDF